VSARNRILARSRLRARRRGFDEQAAHLSVSKNVAER
jgi:hypothetical protein